MLRLPYSDHPIDMMPTKIIAVARNYRAHANEMGTVPPEDPAFFLKPPTSLIGDNGVVKLPTMSQQVDHEVELAVIMQHRCRRVSPDAVQDYLLGYSIIIDVTARDLQKQARQLSMPWAIAKGFDTFAPFGPCIVPAHSLEPNNLDIWLKVNGTYRQQSNTKYMIFPVEYLVSYISHIMTLEPYDIIATGTPEGVGPMRDGDSIEAGIEKIGVLKFTAERES